MKRVLFVLVAALVLVALTSACAAPTPEPTKPAAPAPTQPPAAAPTTAAAPVEIEYWQYFYESKAKLVDELIVEFQKQNPNIKVVHTTFPYEQYNEKVAASVPAGRGPDVINLFYGWLPKYIDSGYLAPLPEKDFPVATIEKDFVPMVQIAKVDGKYYALPTAVRNLAIFYNKDLWTKAGLDPTKPPKTFDELAEAAKKLTKVEGGKMTVAGWRVDLSNQDHNLYREILVRAYGGVPQSDDHKKILWNATPAGYEAWQFLVDLTVKHKVSDPTIGQDGPTAWLAQQAAVMVSGSFYLGTAKSKATFNWGVFPMPAGPKAQANFGSFWTHGITTKAAKDPAKLAASVKFLQFLTSAEVMKKWTPAIGELPARVEVLKDPTFANDPLLAPFLQTLPVSYASYFVDETADRKALMDAYDAVILKNADPKKSLDEAVQKVQKLFDDYWATKK
jgi:multiple sugar transport system substrate-binding protein